MSDIVCHCSACPAKFKVDAKYAGKKAKCPKCATLVEIPIEGILITADEGEVSSNPAKSSAVAVSDSASGAFPSLRTAAAVAESKPAKREVATKRNEAAPALDFGEPAVGSNSGFELQFNSAPAAKSPSSANTTPASKAKTGVQPAVAGKKAPAKGGVEPPTERQIQERKMRFIILSAVAGVLLVACLFVGGLLLILTANKPPVAKKLPPKKPASKMPISKAAGGTGSTKTTKKTK